MAKSPANLDELIREIASEVDATEAAAFAVKPDFFDGHRIDPLIHVRPDHADAAARGAAVSAFREIVSPCVQQAKDGAIEIEGTDNGQGKQYCLVALARQDGKVAGAAAFIVRRRDQQDAGIALMRVQRAATGF